MDVRPWPDLELRTLRRVIPVVQTHTPEPWEVSVVSLEVWDTCLVANVDIICEGPHRADAEETTWIVTMSATDDRGRRYDGYFGYNGGGITEWGEQFQVAHKLVPTLDPRLRRLYLRVNLELRGYSQPDVPVVAAPGLDDPRWGFEITLPPASGDAEGRQC